ncbi:MAG: metallophosphoesterase [Phycisphaerae bacterium]|jgi:hypothetical protein
MHWFLLIFLTLYGAMNSYLFWKVFCVYPQLGYWRIAIAAFLLVMVAGPFIAHYLEKGHWLSLAKVAGFVCYSWMAVAFWFLVLMAAVDVWNLALRGAAGPFPAARLLLVPGKVYLPAIAAIIATLLTCGLLGAQDIQVRRLTIAVPGLPAGRPIRLMQISDLHLGEYMNARRFDRIIGLVQRESPDVLISTGDMVDTSPANLQWEADAFAAITPPMGKFAILGNHEFYTGLPASLAFHEAAGFQVLRQQSVVLDGRVRLAGVDDPAGKRTGQDCFPDEAAALAPGAAPTPTLLLKHQPRLDARSLGRFVIQLSGHTHGGQVFPFQVISRRIYPYYRGLYDLSDGSSLYVNIGAGTWGPPIRLGAPAEVTVFTLTPAP